MFGCPLAPTAANPFWEDDRNAFAATTRAWEKLSPTNELLRTAGNVSVTFIPTLPQPSICVQSTGCVPVDRFTPIKLVELAPQPTQANPIIPESLPKSTAMLLWVVVVSDAPPPLIPHSLRRVP